MLSFLNYAVTAVLFSVRVLDRLGPRAVSSHLRTFADYIVSELNPNSAGGQHYHKVKENQWSFNVEYLKHSFKDVKIVFIIGMVIRLAGFLSRPSTR